MPQNPKVIESIDRALLILDELSGAGPVGLAVGDLSRILDVNKSTIFRALATLRQRGYVTQHPDTGNYSLGHAAVELGQRYFAEASLPVLLHPAVQAVAKHTGEIVHLGVPTGARVIYVDKVQPPQPPIQLWSRIGQTIPAAWSAMGRAILAFQGVPRELIGTYIVDGQQNMDPFGVDQLTEDKLWEEIIFAREQNFAKEIGESQPGVACMSVPILQGSTVIAAMSVTTKEDTLTEERMAEIKEILYTQIPEHLPAGLRLPTTV